MTLVDFHTHLMWYPDHVSERTAQETLDAKLVKLQRSGSLAHAATLDLHCGDAKPEQHISAAMTCDKSIVFGLQAHPVGVWVPNEIIAEHVSNHPDRLEGWASVNPAESGALAELTRCTDELGMRGLKVGPTYQHWDPRDHQCWDVFEFCEGRDLPVIIHQGTTFPSTARLEFAHPLLLERLVMQFPNLRLIVAHMGHPWELDVIALMRKSPNVYTDISALHYRPFRYWQALIAAFEYGVTHKLLFGSDFPSATPAQVIEGLRSVNQIVDGTGLPRFPTEEQDRILFENWRRFVRNPE